MTFLKTRGFTLIELLIVITIIAILSAIGLVMYGQFIKSARDAKRQSDLKFIQSALESYHADQLYYPSLGTGACAYDGKLRFGCPLSNPTGSSNTKTYSTQIPSDPITGRSYTYIAYTLTGVCSGGSDCVSYCLFAQMEASNPPDDDWCTVMPSTPAPPNDFPYNYGITRP